MNKNNDRNLNFYKEYSFYKYYQDYLACNASVLQFLTSDFELKEIYLALKENNYKAILVIGIGFGREIDAILKMSPDVRVSGVDFSKDFINELEARYNRSRVNFYKLDISVDSLKIIKEKFDLIICLNTLEYVHPKIAKSFLNDVNGVLNPNGRIFFRYLNSCYWLIFCEMRHMRARLDSLPYNYTLKYEDIADSIHPEMEIHRTYLGELLPSFFISSILRSNIFSGIGRFFFNKNKHLKFRWLVKFIYVWIKKN